MVHRSGESNGYIAINRPYNARCVPHNMLLPH
uniref:Uncharacterized protein n=1 Tax=Anguilla anguilla TaxID=7936 RepID=A0A0E9UTM0_ANGAN